MTQTELRAKLEAFRDVLRQLRYDIRKAKKSLLDLEKLKERTLIQIDELEDYEAAQREAAERQGGEA